MARDKHDESLQGAGTGSSPEGSGGRITSPRASAGDEFELTLRPRTFDEYVGQRKVVENLKVFVAAAVGRGEALDHVLFSGPPGLGKTTLAHVVAGALEVKLLSVGAPAIEHKGALASYLTALEPRDVLFIDEIHRLPPVVEEYLYPAMEEYRIEIPVGDGPNAKMLPLAVPRFTLIGATTRTGLLSAPLRSRFGIEMRLDYYSGADLSDIVRRSARKLRIELDAAGADEIGRRARGTPRIANRLLRRVRDFAQVEGDGEVTIRVASSALDRLGVDAQGLDEMDRTLLRCLAEKFDGGPAGIESLAAACAEERDTLEEVYEPYLIQEGFLMRTPRGRVALKRAYEHLGLPPPRQGTLL